VRGGGGGEPLPRGHELGGQLGGVGAPAGGGLDLGAGELGLHGRAVGDRGRPAHLGQHGGPGRAGAPGLGVDEDELLLDAEGASLGGLGIHGPSHTRESAGLNAAAGGNRWPC
jgi:hypothetical protein